jgi:hypothetical protein
MTSSADSSIFCVGVVLTVITIRVSGTTAMSCPAPPLRGEGLTSAQTLEPLEQAVVATGIARCSGQLHPLGR